MSELLVKVGTMPGKINEFSVESGTKVMDLLALAGLNPSGYDVKIDSRKVELTNSTKITSSTKLILLVKQVKGNAEVTVKVGTMPGKINEFAVASGTPIEELISLAGLNPSGYDVKVDGKKISNLSTAKVTTSTKLVLLVKQVKGNAEVTVKAGTMPGKINEFVVESGTKVTALLELAGLNPSGYDVKIDGRKTDDLACAKITTSTKLVLLVKQVKGN